jgi:hypothetical protein
VFGHHPAACIQRKQANRLTSELFESLTQLKGSRTLNKGGFEQCAYLHHTESLSYCYFCHSSQKLYKPEAFDFRLRPDSAAVDAGVRPPNINDDFTGRAPDLGAYESEQPLPHYGPRP